MTSLAHRDTASVSSSQSPMHNGQDTIESVILSLLTLTVYLVSVSPFTRFYGIIALTLSFVIFGIAYIVQLLRKQTTPFSLESQTFKFILFILTSGILLWVGNTGWFLSPVFYLLYLVSIALAFLFSPSVSFSFVLVLIGVLLPNIGTVDNKIDIASLIALFLIIPLSYFLRKEYVRRVAKEKKILILEEKHAKYVGKVEEVLSNAIVRTASDLRQPLNDIKQMASYAARPTSSDVMRKTYVDKILSVSQEALDLLRSFEEDTTGKTLVKSPK